jgi:RNA polymerase II-associated factor 1
MAGASSPRLARAVLRPLRADDEQVMEFYLPQEADLSKLEDAYVKPVSHDQVEQVNALSEENGADIEIDDIFPVRHTSPIRLTIVCTLRSNTNV